MSINKKIINKLIPNYENMELEEKYDNCIHELSNIEKKMLEFEEYIYDDWDFIEMNFNFKDKCEYYNHMISTPKYTNMIKIKSILEIEIKKIYEIMNIDLD